MASLKKLFNKIMPAHRFSYKAPDSSLRRLEKPEKKWNTKGYNWGKGVGR